MNTLPLLEAVTTRQIGALRVTKDEKSIALPLAKVDLSARVADRVAQVTVRQTFRNPYPEALEAVYIFPLAGGCAVSDFTMQVAGRTIKGLVRERAQARRDYQQAIRQGRRAALLEQERDDVFTVQVGNLPPGQEATVTLVYSERLPFFEDGSTELRLPLVVPPRYLPGAPLDRMPVGDGVAPDTDAVPDASRITPPLPAEGFDPMTALNVAVALDDGEVADLACSQHATKLMVSNAGLTVTLARQNELLNRDFVLRWRVASDAVKPVLLACNGFAMLSILPPKRDGFLGLARDVVFIVDRSGSMEGQKMVSAARACSILLATLGPRDRFAIQAFDDSVEWLEGGRFVRADEAGAGRGDAFLRGIASRGGTEMDQALEAALRAVSGREDRSRAPILVFITDGQVGDEGRILRRVQKEVGDARIFAIGVDTAVNSGFLTRLSAVGGGTAAFVVPGDALEDALRQVGREIGTPLVTDLTVEGEASALAPARLPDLFAGRASTVFFRHGGGAVRVRGTRADGGRFEATLTAREVALPAIAHLWARARVADLEDAFRLGRHEVKEEIVAISVRHTLLTRFTAFVAVDERVVAGLAGDPMKVVQPVHAPEGWDMLKDKAEDDMVMCEEAGEATRCGLPAPKPCAAPPPPPACAQAPLAKRGAGGLLRSLGAGLGSLFERREAKRAPEPRQTSDPKPIRAAVDALVKAFEAARAEAEKGTVPPAEPLEKARRALMGALADDALGQELGELQRFVRTALAEILAAIRGGASAAEIAALFARHAKALDQARKAA